MAFVRRPGSTLPSANKKKAQARIVGDAVTALIDPPIPEVRFAWDHRKVRRTGTLAG